MVDPCLGYLVFSSFSKLIFVYVSLSRVVQDITYLRQNVFFFFNPAKWFVKDLGGGVFRRTGEVVS